MDRQDRKQALADYRERKAAPGIYAMRCKPMQMTWVGAAPELAAIRNRLFFTLRTGACPHRSLQEAWQAHGADGFDFEVLEKLDPEEFGLGLERELKNRRAAWVDRLGAVRI